MKIIILSIALVILILPIVFIIFISPLFSLAPLHSPNFFLPPEYSLQDFVRPQKTTTLIAVGDIMLGRFVNVKMLQNKDWKYPFLETFDLTSSADITFGNLESPIVEGCPTTSVGMSFCAREESVEGLKFGGFDILSIANNHIQNFGQDGLANTQKILTENNLLFSDSNNVAIKQLNNLKFGFLSFDLVTYPNTPVIEKIKENVSRADVLIVSLHWGAEYQKEPATWQKELARQIIDAGAKIIVGHHPHVVQPVEEYKNGLIFYSLGNFVFDQPWSEETKKGQIAKITFEGKKINTYEIVPIYIQDYCQPVVISGVN